MGTVFVVIGVVAVFVMIGMGSSSQKAKNDSVKDAACSRVNSIIPF